MASDYRRRVLFAGSHPGRAIVLAVLAGALLLSAGCAQPEPVRPRHSAARPVRPPASFDATALAAELRGAGLDVAAPEATATTPFGGASKAVALAVGGGHVIVDTFPSAAEASRVAGAIDEDGSGGPFGGNVYAQVEWRQPPHFFRRDRLIVTYFQSGFPEPSDEDSRILGALAGAMGEQFAGYR